MEVPVELQLDQIREMDLAAVVPQRLVDRIMTVLMQRQYLKDLVEMEFNFQNLMDH